MTTVTTYFSYTYKGEGLPHADLGDPENGGHGGHVVTARGAQARPSHPSHPSSLAPGKVAARFFRAFVTPRRVEARLDASASEGEEGSPARLPSPALGCEVGTSSASGETADAYVSRPFHRETGSIGDRFGADLCGTLRAAPRFTQVSRWDACHQEPRGGLQGAEMASRCSSTAPARSRGGSVAAFKGMWPHERLGHTSWKDFVTASYKGVKRSSDWGYDVAPGLGWTARYETQLFAGWRQIAGLVDKAMPAASHEEKSVAVDAAVDAAGAKAVLELGGKGTNALRPFESHEAAAALTHLSSGAVTADDISERGAEALTSPRPKGQRKAEAADPFRAVVRALDKLSLDRLREHCPRMSVAPHDARPLLGEAHAAPPRHAIGVRHAPVEGHRRPSPRARR